MAVLPDSDRDLVHRLFEDDQFNRTRTPTTLSRADIRAAVNALDDYFDANASNINSAIPQPARGSLTAPQKARLLVWVIERRYLAGA
jgi:hypothetical protein